MTTTNEAILDYLNVICEDLAAMKEDMRELRERVNQMSRGHSELMIRCATMSTQMVRVILNLEGFGHPPASDR